MPDRIDPVAVMLDTIDLTESLARTEQDIFTASSHPMPSGRIFGGQVLGQSILAAQRTLPPDRVPHSLHGYFLRPGDANKPVTISVDRIHDGRSFARRRTQVYQDGTPIFSAIASFETESAGLEHSERMPDGLPGPDDVAPSLGGDDASAPPGMRAYAATPVEIRHIGSPVYLDVQGPHVPRQAVWMRVKKRVPDDPALQRALLAYISDLTIQEPVLRAHGVSWAHRGLKVASLDHAIWWHAPARVDEWLLYVQESPFASGGRGLSTGRIYRADGALAASVAQEIMVRVPLVGDEESDA